MMVQVRHALAIVFVFVGLAGPAWATPPMLTATSLTLPGGPPVVMDYLAVDGRNRVWVPAGDTGRVDVVETGSLKISAISGWPTAKRQTPRGERVVGPSSVAIAKDVVYIGNRADSKVCAVDGKALKIGACTALPASPDGLSYVAATDEVWVTTPSDGSLTILSVAKTPAVAGRIPVGGEPEGYAQDPERGLFFTNLEDKDKTLAVDVKTRRVVKTFSPGCGPSGPRGLAFDGRNRWLFVACTDHLVALDVGHDGKILGRVDTGGGVDNIDYLASRRLLYATAGQAGRLTIAHVTDSGGLEVAATAVTAPGARVVVVDEAGTAYAADSKEGRLLIVRFAQ